MPTKRDIPPRAELVDLYLTQRLSLRAVGAHYGGTPPLVKAWFRHYDIPVHPSGHNLSYTPANVVVVSPELDEILTGELLGDGCVTWGDGKRKAASRTGVFAYCTAKEGYARWLFARLAALGLRTIGTVTKRTTAPGVRPDGLYTLRATHSYRVKTAAYEALREYRVKWYPGEAKRPPADLVITPTVLRHWFIGDGTLLKITSKRPRGNGEYRYSRVVLCTNGFSWEDCELLAAKLNQLGLPFKVLRHRQTYRGVASYRPQLHLPQPAVNTPLFFKYIGPCPEEVAPDYGHKWDWHTRRVPKKNAGPA